MVDQMPRSGELKRQQQPQPGFFSGCFKMVLFLLGMLLLFPGACFLRMGALNNGSGGSLTGIGIGVLIVGVAIALMISGSKMR